jgi:hypothetical protein
MRRIAYGSATGCMGNGLLRGEPVLGAPETPISTSAS